MSQIDERLKALTPAQRALFDARLKEKGLTAPRSRSVQPIPGRERLPWFETSLDQERLWFIDQMEPGNPAYNIHSSSRLHGRIDPALMRRAVNASIARHEVLRTTFGVVDGRPVQIVAPFLEIDVPVLELGPVPPAEREKAGLAAAVEAATERFDLARGPLVRVRLGRLAEDDHVLMMCMHHAITDRFSFDIFEDEISRVYVALRDGTTAAIPPLPIQFADFAAWQREELSGERLERHLGHWRETMAGATLVLDVPGDRPRPAVQTFNGGRAYLVYPEGILVALKDLARRTSATMFMAVLAALDVLCYKHSGQRDFIIGSAIADRNRPETENAIGYFLNMLLLRARIDPAMTFRQLLVQTRERALGAFAHQDVPFATLVAELKPKQDPSRNPLIQVSYIYLDFPIVDTSAYAGLACSSIEVDNGAARFDLTLACTEGVGPGLHSYLEFNTDIYDRARVEGMLRQLGRVLEFAAVSPDLPIASLDILEPAERARTTVAFNDVARPHEPACLDELVERAARAHPDSPALVIGGQTISLARLRDGAESLARRLRAAGAGPGSLVGVAAERSVGQAVALLAVMKSGAAYVPLDLSLPPERLESMLGDARPVAILAQRRLLPSLPPCGAAIVDLDGAPEPAGAAAVAATDAAVRRAQPDDLAFVMFTSGSTGKPKGVMVSHRAILNRILWAQERYPILPGDRVLHNASFGFDIAAWELFGPLLAGAAVVMPREGEHKDPAALARLLRDERVTVAHFVPSLLRPILDEPAIRACEGLRAVFCGGEGMPRDVHDRFFERLPGRILSHFYGPTEAAISCLYHDCDPSLAPGAVPIGAPVSNMRVYLLDETLHPVPEGVAGEIFIGGAGLARGYLGRPDLTADRFVPDSVSGAAGERLYRTGDLARMRRGAIAFIGRTDHQVKIRGYRIELAEVEAALSRIPGVARAVAAATGDDLNRRLVAWIVAEGEAPSETDLRAQLRRLLPEPMIPSAFVLLPALPLGPNGKVDRKALPEPGAAPAVAAYVAPRTAAEEVVAGIWTTLLKRERVGIDDGFFDIGGDSLLATRVVARVRAEFEIDFPLRRLFTGPTVRELAAAVEEILVRRIETMDEGEAARQLEERAAHGKEDGAR